MRLPVVLVCLLPLAAFSPQQPFPNPLRGGTAHSAGHRQAEEPFEQSAVAVGANQCVAANGPAEDPFNNSCEKQAIVSEKNDHRIRHRSISKARSFHTPCEEGTEKEKQGGVELQGLLEEHRRSESERIYFFVKEP